MAVCVLLDPSLHSYIYIKQYKFLEQMQVVSKEG